MKNNMKPDRPRFHEPLTAPETVEENPLSNVTQPQRGKWLHEASREDLVSVLENAPCGIAVLESLKGKTVYINPAAFEMTGYDLSEAPTPRDAMKVMFPRDKNGRSEARHLKKMLASGVGLFLQQIRRKSGDTAICEVRNVELNDGTVVGAWTDVTRREFAEQELRHTEAQFRLFYEQSFDAALLMERERVVDCNQAAIEMMRCGHKATLIGRTLWDLSFRAGAHSISEKRAGLIIRSAPRKKRLRFEWILTRHDGEPFPAEVTVTTTVIDGRNILYVLIRDISALKEAEKAMATVRRELASRVKERTAALTRANEQLRKRTAESSEVNEKLKGSREELRHLYEHLHRVSEEERTRLAREVHDELGHFLMSLKLDLSHLKKGLNDRAAVLVDQATSMEQRVDQALGMVGQICSDLRPHVLDQLGLPSALEWYVKSFQRKSGIACVTDISQDMPPIRKEQETVIFRVFQEAMSNIIRHSEATQATVWLSAKSGSLILRVTDNGKGITREELTSSKSFGLIGIRERVRFWGGKSTFRGTEGKGTAVTITMPLGRQHAGQGNGAESVRPKRGAI